MTSVGLPPSGDGLAGRVGIVAGGGGGFGGEIAADLAGLGVSLGLVDLDEDAVRRSAARCREAGVRVAEHVGDVSDPAFVRQVVKQVDAELGTPTVLVHAVGIYPRSPVSAMTNAEWDTVFRVNLSSAFYFFRAVAPIMEEAGDGRIVAITSGLGNTGSPRGSHYAVSKAGLDALTKSFAAEVADTGIRVNNVAPGLTNTSMMRGANSPDYIASLVARSGRLGEPEDIVPLVRFLLGDGAEHITGQVFRFR